VVEQKGARAYVAELVGTFVLVFFIGMVVSLSSREALGFTDWSVIGLVHAFTLALLVASLAGVCGAHFNPAVTVAMLATKRIRGGDAGVYILMQLAGATLAALLVKGLLLDEGKPVNYGATIVVKAFFQGDFAGFVAEGVGTFLLMATIAGTALIAKNKSDLAPWMIGGALGVAVMCIGPMTGAGVNPARAFGPLLVSGTLGDNFGAFLFVYTLGPVVGALIAAYIIQWLYAEDVQEGRITAAREDVLVATDEDGIPDAPEGHDDVLGDGPR
jgi:MIP family channel proteins